MPFYNAAKQRMLNHLVGNTATGGPITHVSLHSAYPATSGNELSGGGYARQQINWAAASGNSVSASNQPTFQVPAGATVAAVGFWTGATGGTLMADAQVTPETFNNPGTYTVTSASLTIADS